MFAIDVKHVAYMVNSLSGLASAFTILFMFWTITHLARNIVGKEKSLQLSRVIAIMGTGVVGSLAYTFSDTFWFSAVEGEVYAKVFKSLVDFNSLFNGLVDRCTLA